MEQHVLVTGATGTVGQEVAKALQARAIPFTAAVRDVDKAKEMLGRETHAIHFDFEQPQTFDQAVQSVDRVFLLGPPLNMHLDQLIEPFIDYLYKNEIKRVVYLSAFGAESMRGLPFHTVVEQKLKAMDFAWTILRPSFFSQNFKSYEYENITEHGITYMPAGDGKVGFVDVCDVGEVTAAVLTDNQHIHREYVLTGPETLSYYDAAQQLSELIGKPVRYPAPTPEEYTDTLKKSGAPDFIAPYMNEVYGLIRDGKVDQVSPAIEDILHRPPNPLREVLQRTFA